jgi:hypothetical protein
MSKCKVHNTPSPCLSCEMDRQTQAICGSINRIGLLLVCLGLGLIAIGELLK